MKFVKISCENYINKNLVKAVTIEHDSFENYYIAHFWMKDGGYFDSKKFNQKDELVNFVDDKLAINND